MRNSVLFTALMTLAVALTGCIMDTSEGNQHNVELDSATQAVSGWHSLSQAARNQAIVDKTANWADGAWGGQCKAWVQAVVNGASGIPGLIPTNSSNACYWQSGSYVVGRSDYIENAMPGEIVQMDLGGNSPHTAIVIAKGAAGVTFRESNWCSKNCENVGTRYVSYSTFYGQVSCYSVYYVL